MNFQMFKLVLEKAEELEIKLPTSAGSRRKQENSRKTSISALLTMPKPLTVWITISSVQFLSHVWFFATPWITARQASLSITNSWSSPKLICNSQQFLGHPHQWFQSKSWWKYRYQELAGKMQRIPGCHFPQRARSHLLSHLHSQMGASKR